MATVLLWIWAALMLASLVGVEIISAEQEKRGERVDKRALLAYKAYHGVCITAILIFLASR